VIKNLFFISGLLGLVSGPLSAAQVYVWKDPKEGMQYTEAQPAGGIAYEILEVPDSAPSVEEVAETPETAPIEPSAAQPKVIPRTPTAAAETAVISPAPVPALLPTPTRDKSYLNDYAQLLLPEDANALETTLSQLASHSGIEFSVLTLYSIKDYRGGDAELAQFSQRLFQDWKLGAQGKGGLLLLVVLLDQQFRLEADAHFAAADLAQLRERSRDQLVPAFRAGQFSAGIRQTVTDLSQRLTLPAPVSAPVPPPAPLAPVPAVPQRHSLTDPNTWQVFGGFTLGLLALVLGWQFWRRRQHRCPQCGHALLPKLAVAQTPPLSPRDTVRYRLWTCDICGSQLLLAHKHWLRGWQRCPECHNPSLSVTHSQLCTPTATQPGKLLVQRECRICRYTRSEQVTLADPAMLPSQRQQETEPLL